MDYSSWMWISKERPIHDYYSNQWICLCYWDSVDYNKYVLLTWITWHYHQPKCDKLTIQQLLSWMAKVSELRLSTESTCFIGREGFTDMCFSLYSENDLWCHVNLKVDATTSSVNHLLSLKLRLNHLSDEAKRHCGAWVLETIHKHVNGVPRLWGNAFFRCPSCMSGKLCTKNPWRPTDLGSSSTSAKPSNAPCVTPSNGPLSNWEGASVDNVKDE